MKIVSSATMGQLDRRTIEAGTPDAVLMDQAAQAACTELLANLDLLPGAAASEPRFRVLTGKGNNAGDGLVLARLLHLEGFDVAVWAAAPLDELTGAAGEQVERLPEDVPVRPLTPQALKTPPASTVLLDCLLGTGIRGRLRAPFDAIIPVVNRSACPVVAIDLPSGLDADAGTCDPEAVIADLTITLALPKTGLLTSGGLEHCGLLRCVDIGIPTSFASEAEGSGDAVFRQDVAPLLPRRPRGGHKRTFGDLLIIGGSVPYAGAPMLAGGGALRQGTGLVRIAMPAAAAAIAPRRFASLIVHPVGPASGRYFTAACIEDIGRLTERATALVFGCGVGKPREAAPLLRKVLQTAIPLLIDADGLRALAILGADCAKRNAATVLTPHPGEMRALLEGFGMTDLLSAPRSEQAVQLARRLGATVVLKGAGTVAASPSEDACVNTSGTTALATAGTGDVLAGMIGGLLAQGMNSWDACRCGTFVHGLAGEISPLGERGMTADDLVDLIPHALRRCSPFA